MRVQDIYWILLSEEVLQNKREDARARMRSKTKRLFKWRLAREDQSYAH
jgi:hypothetical protein